MLEDTNSLDGAQMVYMLKEWSLLMASASSNRHSLQQINRFKAKPHQIEIITQIAICTPQEKTLSSYMPFVITDIQHETYSCICLAQGCKYEYQ